MLKPLTGRRGSNTIYYSHRGVCVCVRVCACNAVLFWLWSNVFFPPSSAHNVYMLLPAPRARAKSPRVPSMSNIYHRTGMRADRPVDVCQRDRQAAETKRDRQAAEAYWETDRQPRLTERQTGNRGSLRDRQAVEAHWERDRQLKATGIGGRASRQTGFVVNQVFL